MEIINTLIKLLPLLGFLAFVKAIFEYTQSQKWKKSEFLAKEWKEFSTSENTKIVFQLLDWNSREITIAGEKFEINDLDIFNALMTNDDKTIFSKKEAHLRDTFDLFFDKLGTFNVYIENGLISKKEYFLYIGYYLRILTIPGRKSESVVNSFFKYLDFYSFDGAKSLIKKFQKFSKF